MMLQSDGYIAFPPPRRTDSRLRGNGQLGNVQMTRIPVIILPDVKVVIASAILAVAGGCILLRKT